MAGIRLGDKRLRDFWRHGPVNRNTVPYLFLVRNMFFLPRRSCPYLPFGALVWIRQFSYFSERAIFHRLNYREYSQMTYIRSPEAGMFITGSMAIVGFYGCPRFYMPDGVSVIGGPTKSLVSFGSRLDR